MQLISWNSFIFYAFIFYHILNSTKLKKVVIISTALQFILIILINLTIEPLTVHPSYTYAVINSGIILNTFMVFHQIYEEEKVVFLEKNPLFWFNSATLILFCSTIVIFLVRNYFIYGLKSYTLNSAISNIISIIYILNYVMILITLLMIRKKYLRTTPQPQDHE